VSSGEQDTTRATEQHYQEVSLRAVELLAKAQRAADEAVAEAQAYARDLEESARDQYRQILQRAQAAAHALGPAEVGADVVDPETVQASAGDVTGAMDAQQLMYVRTYARVAHAQLKSVLSALNDELDQLAAMAEGTIQPHVSPEAPSPAPEPGDQVTAPDAQSSDPNLDTATREPDTAGSPPPEVSDGAATLPDASVDPDHDTAGDEESWPPIFASTSPNAGATRGG
jgi:hypothetical protein